MKQAVGGTLHNVLNGNVSVHLHRSIRKNDELLERVAARNEEMNGPGDRTFLLSQVMRPLTGLEVLGVRLGLQRHRLVCCLCSSVMYGLPRIRRRELLVSVMFAPTWLACVFTPSWAGAGGSWLPVGLATL